MDENTMIAFVMLLIWGTYMVYRFKYSYYRTLTYQPNQKKMGQALKTLQNILKIKGKEIEDADELMIINMCIYQQLRRSKKIENKEVSTAVCAITDALLIHPDQAGTREKFIATNLANYYTINGAESESKRIISLIHQGVHENPSARLMDITIAAVEQMLKNRKEAQPEQTA